MELFCGVLLREFFFYDKLNSRNYNNISTFVKLLYSVLVQAGVSILIKAGDGNTFKSLDRIQISRVH